MVVLQNFCNAVEFQYQELCRNYGPSIQRSDLRIMIGPDFQRQLSAGLYNDRMNNGAYTSHVTIADEHGIAPKPSVLGIPLIVSEQVDGDEAYLCIPLHKTKA